MRIDIEAARSQLASENAGLAEQMASAARQRDTMSSTSCSAHGLAGAAFEAMDARIRMRALVLDAHFLAFESIRSANTENLGLVSALPSSLTNGVLDTAECDDEIARLKELIRQQEIRRGSLYNLISRASDDSFGPPLENALMNDIHSNTQAVIDAHEDEIRMWEEKKRAAYDYSAQSGTLYDDARDYAGRILAQATSAVAGCIRNGSYDENACGRLAGSLRLAAMREYLEEGRLTEEEVAALRAALRDGAITEEEIYCNGRLKEALYSALAKLPPGLVTPGDVRAIADAYETMWLRGDTGSVERLIELSYVQIPGRPSYCHDPSNSYVDFHLFEQAPLLGRVAGSVTGALLSRDKGSSAYQRLLAAANLIDLVSRDEARLWTDKVSVSLHYVGSRTGDAAFCVLDFNPANSRVSPWQYFDGNVIREVVSGFRYCAFTGEINDVYHMAEAFKNSSLAEGDFDLLGFTAGQVASGILGAIPYGLGMPLSVYTDYASALDAAERGGVVGNSDLGAIGSNAGSAVLRECGYALNLRFDADSRPGAYLAPEARVYMPDSARGTFEGLAAAYNQSAPEGRVYTYTVDRFIGDMQADAYNSVVPDLGTNQTRHFIEWCDAPADLDGFENTTNYYYVLDREAYDERVRGQS